MVNACSIAEADEVVIFPKKSMGRERKGDSIVSGDLSGKCSKYHGGKCALCDKTDGFSLNVLHV